MCNRDQKKRGKETSRTEPAARVIRQVESGDVVTTSCKSYLDHPVVAVVHAHKQQRRQWATESNAERGEVFYYSHTLGYSLSSKEKGRKRRRAKRIGSRRILSLSLLSRFQIETLSLSLSRSLVLVVDNLLLTSSWMTFERWMTLSPDNDDKLAPLFSRVEVLFVFLCSSSRNHLSLTPSDVW